MEKIKDYSNSKRGLTLFKIKCDGCSIIYTKSSGKLRLSERTKFSKHYHSRSCQATHANPNWKGGKKLHKKGYVQILIDGKYVLEHRYIMEQLIGRTLTEWETVHHINGNRSDNRPENLELKINEEHPQGFQNELTRTIDFLKNEIFQLKIKLEKYEPVGQSL